MSYESLKAKYPELNWEEAEQLEYDDPSALQDAADYFDREIKERKQQIHAGKIKNNHT